MWQWFLRIVFRRAAGVWCWMVSRRAGVRAVGVGVSFRIGSRNCPCLTCTKRICFSSLFASICGFAEASAAGTHARHLRWPARTQAKLHQCLCQRTSTQPQMYQSEDKLPTIRLLCRSLSHASRVRSALRMQCRMPRSTGLPTSEYSSVAMEPVQLAVDISSHFTVSYTYSGA